ncbi:MAG: hypothetical protein MUF61_02310 [archaeon]|nr:hypothetical protein [archaeon]
MFRDIAIRYLAGHEEKDENGKKKKVPGEIQKNLEKDPDIKVRGDKVVEALTGQYVNACVGALAVVEGSGHRYVNRKLGDYASEFDEAVGKDKEVYARHGIAQLKADEDYEAIGQALGAIKPEKKK